MSKCETPSRHVSIQALRFEPSELTTEPEVFKEKEPERKRWQEMLCRLWHVSCEDPRNFIILFLRDVRNLTFMQMAEEPHLCELSPDNIRQRYNRVRQRFKDRRVPSPTDYRSQPPPQPSQSRQLELFTL